MLRRNRHAAERGQTLLLVMAFLAFFVLVAASILTFASTVESQRASTERTAARDSVADGSSQFALGDTRGQGCPAPGTVSSGTMQFPSTIESDKLHYDVPAGSSGCQVSSTGGSAAGSACELCLLNTSSPNAGTTVLGTNRNGISVNGEVDANGSISGSGTVTATGPGAKIALLTGATCTITSNVRPPPPACSPTPTTQLTPFNDPLAGTMPIPTNGAQAQTCNACGVISPGVYSTITVNPNTVWMKTGVYIVTGQLYIAGSGGLLTNSDSSSGGITTDSDSGGAIDSDPGGVIDSDSGGQTASGSGNSVGYSSNTLVDTSKTWTPGQWVNAVVMAQNSTETDIVASNTATTLTMNTPWTARPANHSAYAVSSKIGYSSNTLVDTSKNWTAGQLAGLVVTVTPLGGATETDIVASNTATTLTMSSPWSVIPSAGNGYVISKIGYTSNTLVDGSKNWATNQWADFVVTVTPLGGATETDVVASNTATTLTMRSPWSVLPSAGNGYVISKIGYTSNTLVDGSKNWATNQWAGAIVTVTVSNTTATVASNTSNTLTMTSNWSPTTPSPGNAYVLGLSTISYTSNTLVDTSKTWVANQNQWAGAIVTVTLSNNTTETNTVASNTSSTLTMTQNWGTTPSSGNAYSIVAPVAIYLACNTSAPYWSCATGGQSGGYISTAGQGTFAVNPFTTGPYAGLSIFTDPNLLNPSALVPVVEIGGNGGSFGGSIYVPRGSIDVSGGGVSGTGATVISGRVIVQSLSMGANGNSNAILTLTGTGPSGVGLAGSACYYYNDSLTGTEASGTSGQGHVQFEAGCSSAGLNGQGVLTKTSIINFAYGP
jgi:hypothetical protein